MKSSPILGHPPNSFLTRGRGFQSYPIQRVNCGVGNTGNAQEVDVFENHNLSVSVWISNGVAQL